MRHRYGGPIRLRPRAERDALLAEYLETTEFVDPSTFEPWVPTAEDLVDRDSQEDE